MTTRTIAACSSPTAISTESISGARGNLPRHPRRSTACTIRQRELPKGRTVFQKLDQVKSHGRRGTLKAEFELVGPDGKAIGAETQEYTFSGDASSRIIDCIFTLTANKGVPLKMGDTKEGTFAIRVVNGLTEPGLKMLNSEGKVGVDQIWGKRANWVDYSGEVDGESLGIAIFDNPANLKHPTYWHARDYGLFAVNPFGEHDFYHDPKRDGSVTIAQGQVAYSPLSRGDPPRRRGRGPHCRSLQRLCGRTEETVAEWLATNHHTTRALPLFHRGDYGTSY